MDLEHPFFVIFIPHVSDLLDGYSSARAAGIAGWIACRGWRALKPLETKRTQKPSEPQRSFQTRGLAAMGRNSNRGGSRNLKKPDVDSTHLYDILEGYMRKVGCQHAFEFGRYNVDLEKQSACNAQGLIKASGLVQALFQVSEGLALKYGQLKEVFTALQRNWQNLREQRGPVEQVEWPAKIAQVVGVILTHVRRLSNEKKFKECCSKATDWQMQELLALRDMARQAQEEDLDSKRSHAETESELGGDSQVEKKLKVAESLPMVEKEILVGSLVEQELQVGGLAQLPQTPDSSECSPVPVSKKKIREAWDDEASPMVKKRPAGKEPLTKTKELVKKNKASSSQKGRMPKAEITEEERQKLILMDYKKTGACAIRVRESRQLMQVKAKTLKHSKVIAEKIMLKIVRDGLGLEEAMEFKVKLMKALKS